MIAYYRVTQEDIDREGSFEPDDVGRWYLVVNGTIFFFSDEKSAREMAIQLNRDNRGKKLSIEEYP